MNEITLDEILVSAHNIEFSQFDNAPEYVFSKKHERIMRRIFKRYEKNIAKLRGGVEDKNRPVSHLHWNRKTVIIVLTMILLAVLAGCAVIIYSLGGFRTDVNADNTQLFPVEINNCPQSIEEVYYLSELPDGFELQEESTSDISIYKKYLNSTTGQIITLHQSIKKAFEPHYNTEISDLEEIQINEYTGILLCDKENYIIAWDNGDYILQLSTNISKEKTIYLAKMLKFQGNKNNCSQNDKNSDFYYRSTYYFLKRYSYEKNRYFFNFSAYNIAARGLFSGRN